ncbi:electron transport complex subunit RsxG [Parahaliea aestuarii]|uniref:Ion-translocating oxidoreductase complex subunit G n=1 Tax=Parahaliea aestuarii TaxID=1852021 RepID=A0A5C8ZQK4_9GAMM|nr:electron transport complex subunit RsxG [Parahaliea aestuarii]TXS89777.1 electron transport complex subunit RsxG [Parahaliea aestuarii]
MLGQSISRNSLLLGLFAVITTVLIAGTYLSTRDRIAEAQRQAEEKALLEIIPDERHDNNMLDDTVTVAAGTLGLKQDKPAYIARRGQQAIAVILPATAPDGYSGAIELIIGVNRDGSVAGVRVLNHRETPGLGDKVELSKSDWILGFNGRSLENPEPDSWAVKKDGGAFDQFTGATITPRAVVAATRGALEYARDNNGRLFGVAAGESANTADQGAE